MLDPNYLYPTYLSYLLTHQRWYFKMYEMAQEEYLMYLPPSAGEDIELMLLINPRVGFVISLIHLRAFMASYSESYIIGDIDKFHAIHLFNRTCEMIDLMILKEFSNVLMLLCVYQGIFRRSYLERWASTYAIYKYLYMQTPVRKWIKCLN